jgi:hypothetical protein
MDNQAFAALMGSVPEPGSEGDNAIVSQLRGQHDLGGLNGFSPELKDMGQSMQQGALDSAKEIGTRRKQGLDRSIAAENQKYSRGRDTLKDTLAAEKLAYDRGGWTDIEERENPSGEVALYGLKDGRGPLVKIPESDNLKERDKIATRAAARAAGGAPKRLHIEGTNLEYLRYPNGMIVYGTAEYPNMQAFAAARPDIMSEGNAAQADEKYATDFAGELAKGIGKEVTDLRTGLAKTNSSYGSSEANMRGIINAVDQGANPGQVYAMLPTITNATSLLESIVSAESLELLNTYQLKPVSDKDLAVLRQVAGPTLDGPALKAWAENKIAVLQRAQASGRVFEDWVANNNRVPRGEERDQLQKEMFAAADAAGSDPGLVDLSSTSSTQTTKGSVDPGTGIVTLANGKRFNADGTPVQ